MQSPDPTPHPHPFTAGFTKRQHQQLQRLVRADRWLHARTRRSISRGDAHWKTFRRLRKGLIELLRAALLQLGDQGAGGYRWRQLLARAQALLPANAACNAALNLFSEMPYRTVESTQHGSREELLAHLAIVQRYQSAAWDVQFVAGMVAGGAIGLVEGCWLRLSPYSSPCFVLRYNGISALLGYAQDQSVQDHVDLLAALAKGQLQRIDDPSEIESLNQRLFTPLGSAFWRDEDGDEDEDGLTQSAPTIDPDYAHLPLIQTCDIAGLYYHQAKAVAAHIAAGMVVCLRRDPDNAFDADAIDVRMPADLPAGEKLGYIPRLCNQPLARRMDKGVAVLARISLVRWREGVQQGRPARIEIEIRIERHCRSRRRRCGLSAVAALPKGKQAPCLHCAQPKTGARCHGVPGKSPKPHRHQRHQPVLAPCHHRQHLLQRGVAFSQRPFARCPLGLLPLAKSPTIARGV